VILLKNKLKIIDISDKYKLAEERTRFKPTFFLIYDQSTPTNCNRLIVVEPFKWLIWAINNDVYILDNAVAQTCPVGSSPAYKLTEDIHTIKSICINIMPDALINLYNDPIRVDYDVTETSVANKFTILDALNILFKNYITIDFSKPKVERTSNSILKLNELYKFIGSSGETGNATTDTNTTNLLINKRFFQRHNPKVYDEMYERIYSSRDFTPTTTTGSTELTT